MAIDLDGIIKYGPKVRKYEDQIVALAKRAREGFVKADGSIAPPHPNTIAEIKAEAAIIIPLYEAAHVDFKAAYTS